MFKQYRQLLAFFVALMALAIGASAQSPAESPTLGVRYFRIAATTDAEYKSDAKALASSLRIALDNSKGFKQIVTLDDEQIEQLTKLIADSKKALTIAPCPAIWPNRPTLTFSRIAARGRSRTRSVRAHRSDLHRRDGRVGG